MVENNVFKLPTFTSQPSSFWCARQGNISASFKVLMRMVSYILYIKLVGTHIAYSLDMFFYSHDCLQVSTNIKDSPATAVMGPTNRPISGLDLWPALVIKRRSMCQVCANKGGCIKASLMGVCCKCRGWWLGILFVNDNAMGRTWGQTLPITHIVNVLFIVHFLLCTYHSFVIISYVPVLIECLVGSFLWLAHFGTWKQSDRPLLY